MEKHHINVLISEEDVDQRIKEIGEQISKDYAGKEVHLVCVLRGGSFFMCELAKRITVPVSLDFMSVSSYGNICLFPLKLHLLHRQQSLPL